MLAQHNSEQQRAHHRRCQQRPRRGIPRVCHEPPQALTEIARYEYAPDRTADQREHIAHRARGADRGTGQQPRPRQARQPERRGEEPERDLGRRQSAQSCTRHGQGGLARPLLGWWLDADCCPGARRGLRQRVYPEFCVDVLEVLLDGAGLDAHPAGGLGGGVAEGG
jgi:hypothetical protein